MVKDGYKQTDIGVIPEDWKVKKLSESFEFKNGLNKAKEFFGHGTPIVNYMDVFNYYGLKKEDIIGKVEVTNDELKNYNVKKGDVFFTRTSETVDEIGISAVIIENTDNTVFSGFILRARPIDEFYNLNYKKYCFLSKEVRKQITSTSSYTTRALTNGKLLSNISIAIPPIEEQKAIATVLSDTDELINSLEKLISKKEAIKTATMQQLLTGKKRLDGFSGEWEEKKFGDIGQSIIGLTYKPENISDFGTLVLRSSNVQNNRLLFKDNVYVNMDLPKRIIVEKDDILICVRNGSRRLIGKCALIDDKTVGQAFGAFMLVFRTKFAHYVFYQFQSNMILKQIEETMGATINQITNKDMASFSILMPFEEAEINAITSVLTEMDKELKLLKTRLEKIKAIKEGMMQELLTGRTRLI